MDELFIIKAIIDVTDSKGFITPSNVIRAKICEEFPTDEEIMEMKQEFHADRCEVAKIYR